MHSMKIKGVNVTAQTKNTNDDDEKGKGKRRVKCYSTGLEDEMESMSDRWIGG